MARRILIGSGMVLVAAALIPLFASGRPKPPKPQHANFAAPAFTPVIASEHNNMGSSACGNFVNSQQGEENNGDLNARKGSFLENVQIPKGATITNFRLYANDFDAEDSFAFLIRKQVGDGFAPAQGGYSVMAEVKTDGAVMNTMRAFDDSTIETPVVDNKNFYYFIELVNCANIEPFSVQITYQPKARRKSR
jgi:hypothetical protein